MLFGKTNLMSQTPEFWCLFTPPPLNFDKSLPCLSWWEIQHFSLFPAKWIWWCLFTGSICLFFFFFSFFLIISDYDSQRNGQSLSYVLQLLLHGHFGRICCPLFRKVFLIKLVSEFCFYLYIYLYILFWNGQSPTII